MTTLHLGKSINRSPLRRVILFIPLVLTCFALSPTAQAALGPEDTAYGTGALSHEAGGSINSAFGYGALFSNTTGSNNTAAGAEALFSNTTGGGNTATGAEALAFNTTGVRNTAIGLGALSSNTTGYDNTANGFAALSSNTIGIHNTANGMQALDSNTTGNSNTADGFDALVFNTTGAQNTATGAFALYKNTTASNNTAYGYQALYSNTTGINNTANGFNALYHNTSGYHNVANGLNTLLTNTTGHDNTAEGYQALNHNTGSNNIGLGSSAGSSLTTGSNNVCIGSGVLGVAAESNTTRIRNVYSSIASGRAVYVNSDNKIGTLASTRRVKENIKPMDKASEAILTFRPVSFRYKKEIDASCTPQFGLIAEDVADINPDLVTRDAEGKPETVRYDSINAMLLNEFLKEHQKVQRLEAALAAVNERLKAQDAKIDKVNAKVELTKPAPQTVLKQSVKLPSLTRSRISGVTLTAL